MNEEQQKWFQEWAEELDQAIPRENAFLPFDFENDEVNFTGTRNGYLRLCSRIIKAVLKSPAPGNTSAIPLLVDTRDLVFGSREFIRTGFILVDEALSDETPPALPSLKQQPASTLRNSVMLLGCGLLGAGLLIALIVGITTIIKWFL